jgi:formate dehydrogenase subunit beta
MRTVIPVEKNEAGETEAGVLAAVRGFLKRLLESGAVEAVMVPMETPSGTVTPALVADPALLDAANPLAPVMGLNVARQAGRISIRKPRGRIGVTLRSCELRALVELVKLQQASLEDLVTIGVDCAGTYDVAKYVNRDQGSGIKTWYELYQSLITDLQSPIPDLRDACQMCEKPQIEGADITLELFGADLAAGIPVSVREEVAERFLAALGMTGAAAGMTAGDGRRSAVVDKVVAERTKVRDAWFAEIRERLDKEGVEGVFAACVRCHNCMTVCPICYCKTCLFKSPTFDHEPMLYLNWARRKGAYRLPADTMLFHLTRLNHMVLSCIGCGLCTSDCPAELPVGRVFRAIGQEVQKKFDYVPGRSVEEALPLVTFREDEWTDVGEE